MKPSPRWLWRLPGKNAQHLVLQRLPSPPTHERTKAPRRFCQRGPCFQALQPAVLLLGGKSHCIFYHPNQLSDGNVPAQLFHLASRKWAFCRPHWVFQSSFHPVHGTTGRLNRLRKNASLLSCSVLRCLPDPFVGILSPPRRTKDLGISFRVNHATNLVLRIFMDIRDSSFVPLRTTCSSSECESRRALPQSVKRQKAHGVWRKNCIMLLFVLLTESPGRIDQGCAFRVRPGSPRIPLRRIAAWHI
jgi:hypothetical protein